MKFSNFSFLSCFIIALLIQHSATGQSNVLIDANGNPVSTILPKANPLPAIQYKAMNCGGFFDGFENGTFNNWTIEAGTFTRTIDTTNAANGSTKSFKQVGGSSNGHLHGVSYQFTPSKPTEISGYISSASTSDYDAYFVVGNSNLNSVSMNFNTDCMAFVYCKDDGYLTLYVDASTNVSIAYNAYKWYFIEFRNIDYINQIFDFYIDGSLLAASFPFRGASVTDVSNVHLYNFSSGSTAWWDEISINYGNPMAITLTGSEPSCYSDSTGVVDLLVSGGTPPYTYGWSTGDTTEDISNIPSGTYSVVVTDSSGLCVANDTITLQDPPTLLDSISWVDVLCAGDSTGSISLSVSGGTGSYNYAWSNGDTVPNLSGLFSGSYFVDITDSNNCILNDSATISEPPVLTSNAIVIDETIGNSDGSIDLTITGGTSPFAFNWSNGATTEDITGLLAGNYQVTVTDSNGCMLVDSIVVNGVVGFKPMSGTKRYEIYPNPSSGEVQIDIPAFGNQDVKLEVFNNLGALLESHLFDSNRDNSVNVNLGNYGAGQYIIRFTSDLSAHEKVVIIK